MRTIVLATINAKWIHPSYALRLLKANLEDLEPQTQILEFNLRQPLSEKLNAILTARPRILGLSVSIWNHEATLELLSALRCHWSTTPAKATPAGSRPIIVLGGPEAAQLPDDAPLLQAADWLVRGEGEIVFRQLCRYLLAKDSQQAPPLKIQATIGQVIPLSPSTLDARQSHVIIAQPFDLTTIQSGYKQYSALDLEKKISYVEASRGCPYHCDFCLSALDQSVRFIKLESFLADMSWLFENGAKAFKLLDRTFNIDIERAISIAVFFRNQLKNRPGSYVHFELVPHRLPTRLLEEFARFPAGSLRLEVGLQTLNPVVAKTINRIVISEDDLVNFQYLCRQTAALVHADLIVGLPGETLASFGNGFDRLWAARPAEIQVGILKKLPGTPIARHDAVFGMRYAQRPPYEVIESTALPKTDCDQLKNFARFWELIVNRGHFTDLVEQLLPAGESAFWRFLQLSNQLYSHFGRAWAIPRAELRSQLQASCMALAAGPK